MAASTTVEAGSPEEALKKALVMFEADKAALLESNTADEGAAFDWQPNAEPI